jgi:hypothetical protein
MGEAVGVICPLSEIFLLAELDSPNQFETPRKISVLAHAISASTPLQNLQGKLRKIGAFVGVKMG